MNIVKSYLSQSNCKLECNAQDFIFFKKSQIKSAAWARKIDWRFTFFWLQRRDGREVASLCVANLIG